MRQLKYREAISEGLCQAMKADPNVFVAGIGADYSSFVFGTTKEACERWPDRVFDVPAMENALTGIAIGAAAMGKRPVIVHSRADFSFLAFDMLVNLAAKYRYMFGGNAGTVPIVTRMIIGRGWGQGATHSQSVHSMLANVPGLAVAMPASPQDAFDVTSAALKADYPTVILEHRSLFETSGIIETGTPSRAPSASVFRFEGHTTQALTIVAVSAMCPEAMRAADTLQAMGISTEVVQPVWIRPMDDAAILHSVAKTGHLLVCDVTHELCGFASEVCAVVAEKAFASLKGPVRRLTLPDCPCPTAHSLEEAFYPKASTIAALALDMLGIEAPEGLSSIDRIDSFKGPY